MTLTPNKISQDLKNSVINKTRAVELLITLIENSEKEDIRLESIKLLEEINTKNDKIFKILENLMISDSNREIRAFAINYIRKSFLEKAISPIKWAIQYESDYRCRIMIIGILVDLNNEESKQILINIIKQIKKSKYINDEKRIENRKFKKSLKTFLKRKKFENLTCISLAEIIINYITISELTKKFYSVYFELKDSLVISLDLSDVEYEVRGWKSDFKNDIMDISEITGLKNLRRLNYLNLSNNQIKDIKYLNKMTSLTHLFLNNNKIEDIKNLEYLKRMKNLKYLNLSGNPITDYLTIHDFEGIEVNLRRSFF